MTIKKKCILLFVPLFSFSTHLSPLYGIEPSQVLDALQNNPLAAAAGGGVVGGLATTGAIGGAAGLGYAAKKSYERHKEKQKEKPENFEKLTEKERARIINKYKDQRDQIKEKIESLSESSSETKREKLSKKLEITQEKLRVFKQTHKAQNRLRIIKPEQVYNDDEFSVHSPKEVLPKKTMRKI